MVPPIESESEHMSNYPLPPPPPPSPTEVMLTYNIPLPAGRKAVLILPFHLSEEAQRLAEVILAVAFQGSEP